MCQNFFLIKYIDNNSSLYVYKVDNIFQIMIISCIFRDFSFYHNYSLSELLSLAALQKYIELSF